MEPEKEPISRRGYALKDLARSFVQVLGESGPEATGKLLHYTADFICSGGFELWQKICWDFCFEHIGIASPRIFVFLAQKMILLNEAGMKLPMVRFMSSPEIQKGCAEIVLIMQLCPKKQKVKWPVVPQETHMNEEWLFRMAQSGEKKCVRKVWNSSLDLPPLMYASNELVQNITDGALEKALFWTRWIIEEDLQLRKKFGGGLSSIERGPGSLGTKQRQHPGYFLCAVFAECYKELAEKNNMRMHEEFQCLLDIYRSTDKIASAKRRQDALILMVQILTEVPRWRVPAAPTLIKDQVVLARAVQQSEVFFSEIMKFPLPEKPLPNKVGSLALRKVKEVSKLEKIESHLSDVDRAIMEFYGGF
jgi:hypothetical protein